MAAVSAMPHTVKGGTSDDLPPAIEGIFRLRYSFWSASHLFVAPLATVQTMFSRVVEVLIADPPTYRIVALQLPTGVHGSECEL
jgi:hypothetical protein